MNTHPYDIEEPEQTKEPEQTIARLMKKIMRLENQLGVESIRQSQLIEQNKQLKEQNKQLKEQNKQLKEQIKSLL